MKKNITNNLTTQQDALAVYLEDLLCEPDEDVPAENNDLEEQTSDLVLPVEDQGADEPLIVSISSTENISESRDVVVDRYQKDLPGHRSIEKSGAENRLAQFSLAQPGTTQTKVIEPRRPNTKLLEADLLELKSQPETQVVQVTDIIMPIPSLAEYKESNETPDVPLNEEALVSLAEYQESNRTPNVPLNEAALLTIRDGEDDHTEAAVLTDTFSAAQYEGSQSSETCSNHSQGKAAGRVVIPAWAEQRFQCLTFNVAELKIAVPLEKLNGIIEWPDNITVLPGHKDWFVGLYRNRNQNVQVIDLALALKGLGMPGLDPEPVSERARYIMLVNDGTIGFASDTVANMLTIEPRDVKWQGGGAVPPVFAGTVLEGMHSVLDVDTVVKHILQS